MSKGVNIKIAYELMKIYALSGKPVLLRSNHGIGKSSIVYDLGTELNKKVVERRLSQMSEGDMTGVPKHKEITINGKVYDSTQFAPPDWILQCVEEPCILFLDEIDRAILELRQGAFQIMDSKAFNGIKLHPDTIIIAAINGGPNSNDSYQVSNLDPAELSRYSVIDIILDAKIWLAWAKTKNLHNSIINFITQDSKNLAHHGNFIPDVVYPSPRSWHRLSDVLYKFESGKSNQALALHIAESFVGYEIAPLFYKFYVKEYKVYSLVKLLDGEYDISLLKPNEKASLCSLEHMNSNSFSLVGKTTPKNMKNLISFAKCLEPEMLILFLSNLFFSSSHLMNTMNYQDFPINMLLSDISFKQHLTHKFETEFSDFKLDLGISKK